MKDNKLGIMPISKLIWNMSLPIIVSMLVQALYNIVDSVFVSQDVYKRQVRRWGRCSMSAAQT